MPQHLYAPHDAQHDRDKLRPHVPESLHGQHDPLSISRIDNDGALEALKSSDPPERPKWQTVLEDWVPVKIPRSVFDKWNAERLKDCDHSHFEYDRITETMIIKCMPSKIHDRVPVGSPQTEEMLHVNRPLVSRSGAFGWSEPPRDLIADSQLWLWGTKPAVEFVFVVEHVESKAQIQEKNRDPEQSLSNGEPICDPDDRYYADDDNAERRSTSKRLDETTSAASR
ncbi:hypothetical protein V8E54_002528 [Elaphomyces granulatus]